MVHCNMPTWVWSVPSSISKSKFEASRSASASPSPGFGLSLQTTVVMEICSELGYGVVDGVGGHTRCLRDRICPELRGRDIPSESEKVVEKGVPLQYPTTSNCDKKYWKNTTMQYLLDTLDSYALRKSYRETTGGLAFTLSSRTMLMDVPRIKV